MAITQINSSKPLTIKGTKFIKSFAGIDEYKLANGLRVILKPNTNVPMISFQVWYKVGSRNESLGLTGLAHYLEHIMFKGTKQFGKGEIAQSITLKGGIFNAFTSDDYTAYFENFSPENLELAIKIESDRMQNSRLDFEEVELERSVIVSELEGNRNQPQNNLYEIMRSAAFNVHTYRNPVIGWKEDLNNINANNMRDFYQTYYYPDNARVVLVGNFDHELALTLIEKYFGQYKPRNKEFPVLTPEPEQKALKQVTIYNGGNSKLLGIAYHIPEFKNKDSVALHILADILFGGMTSRLYPKLVDSGLCNDISGAAESNIDASMFRILINLNPETDPKEVEQIIDREFELVKNNINIEELNLSKAREESSFVYQADGVYDEGLQLGFFDIVAGDWTRYVTWLDDVKACSIDDVQRVAKQYFKPDNKTLVVSLPNKSPEALIPIQETTTITGNESGLDSKVHANYGANVVEPLSPEKLAKLNKLTEAKFSKKAVFPKMQLDFKSLDLGYSGWKVFHKQDSNLPLIFGNIYLYGGSANDTTRPGISYLTSQMLTRGSKFKDKYEISKLTDIYGSDIGFSSTKETARISFSSISKNIDEVVSLLDEVLKNPRFDQAELDKLKAQTIAQIKQEDDYPQRISRRDITRLIYPV
ncbi:MAG: insulinase family protein, partial [Candidatus Caenarcaniphilales bacterium]|nr:insulinase family protein [Candidatus Caenarcaniphilales bacterium]